jgi:LPXTG-motif cell wall-anchored protein
VPVRLLVRRVVASLSLTFLGVLALVAPAAADDKYPPAIGPGGTAVEGTKTGAAGGGLPHTGFQPGYLWIGVALLLLGVALVVVARRRHSHS